MPEPEPNWPPPIPDYTLLRHIGQGAYGEVWLARGVIGVLRAIKLVRLAPGQNDAAYEREFNGLKRFAELSFTESSQLAILHVGRDDPAGFFYYVMELADDVDTGDEINPEQYTPKTLKAVRARAGRLCAEETVRYGADLAEALGRLHAHDLVHGDIKPANIIFVGGRPKLADIGLVAPAILGLSVVGTPGYIPPQGPRTQSADIYALGKVLYECVTGLDRQDFPRLPLDLGSPKEARSLFELNSVIVRACDRRQEHRHPSALALRDDLRLLQAGRSIQRLRQAERSVRKLGRVAAGLGLIALVAGGGMVLERRRTAEAEAERDRLRHRYEYSQRLNGAASSVRDGYFVQAREQLLGIRSDYVTELGPEWHFLWQEANPSPPFQQGQPTTNGIQELRPLAGTGEFVVRHSGHELLRWNPASQISRRLAGDVADLGPGTSEAKLEWFDTRRGLRAYGRKDLIPAPAGRLAATAPDHSLYAFREDSDLTRLTVWRRNGTNWALRFTAPIEASAPSIFGTVLSREGHRLAFARFGADSPNHWIEWWDLNSSKLLQRQNTDAIVWALDLEPNGKCVAAGTQSGTVALLVPGRPPPAPYPMFNSNITALRFSPDGRRLAACDGVGEVRVLDLQSRQIVFKTQVADPFCLAWTDDGLRLAVGLAHGRIEVFKLETVPCSLAFSASHPSKNVALRDDGGLLAATSGSNSIQMVTFTNGLPRRSLGPGRVPILFRKSGELLTLGGDGFLDLWSLKDPVPVAHRLPVKALPSATFIPVREMDAFALVARDGTFEVRDDDSGELRSRRAPGPSAGSVNAAAWNRRRGAFVLGEKGGRLIEWTASTNRLVARLPAAVMTLALAPSGNWVAVVTADGRLLIVDVAAGAIVARPETPFGLISALAFAPDGRRLFVGIPGGTLAVYSTDDWTLLTRWRITVPESAGGNRTISALKFSDDGRLLVAQCDNGAVCWWRQPAGPL